MTDFSTWSVELTKSPNSPSLWTRHPGKRPTNGRTEVRGNVVAYVLADAAGDLNKSMIPPQSSDTVPGVGKLTLGDYKREAIAAMVGLTRQWVTSSSFVAPSSRQRG